MKRILGINTICRFLTTRKVRYLEEEEELWQSSRHGNFVNRSFSVLSSAPTHSYMQWASLANKYSATVEIRHPEGTLDTLVGEICNVIVIHWHCYSDFYSLSSAPFSSSFWMCRVQKSSIQVIYTPYRVWTNNVRFFVHPSLAIFQLILHAKIIQI